MADATLPEGAPSAPLSEDAAATALAKLRNPPPAPKPVAKPAAPAPEAGSDAPADEPSSDEPPADGASDEPATDDAPPAAPVAVDVPTLAKALGLEESDLVDNGDGTVSLKTKIDGRDGTVKPNDLRKGYQQEQAYTRRSEQLAEDRRQLDQQRQNQLTEFSQQKEALAVSYRLATQLLQGEYANVDWAKLRTENPNEYLLLKDQYDQRQNGLRQLYATLSEDQQKQLQDRQKELHTWRVGQAQEIVNHIPEWRDAKVAERDLSAIYTAAKSDYGISQAELDQLYDSRYVRILKDAAAYRALQAKKPATMAKVRTAPAVAKPGAQGQPRNPVADAQAAFKANPSEDNAAALFAARRAAAAKTQRR